MMLHLIKYEIKSTYRIFLTIVASFILLTVLFCISMTNQSPILMLIFSLLSVMIGFATFIAYFITILSRYYKNIYGREGYLMLTLPVKGWQIVCSKFIIAMFWSVILGIAICLCLLATLQYILWLVPPNYPYTLWSLLKEFFNLLGFAELFYMVMVVMATVAETIARIYFVISVAYLPIVCKGNIVVALALFFGIDLIETIFINRITSNASMDIVDIINNNLYLGYGFLIFSVIITVVLLLCSSYIMSKKISIR